jgi:hypothetical protein
VTETGAVKLYRAVSEEEFAQVLRTGRFSSAPGSMEGKFFAERLEDARMWGERFESFGQFRMLEVEMELMVVQAMRYWPRLDGIGPAWLATIELANRAVAIREASDESS